MTNIKFLILSFFLFIYVIIIIFQGLSITFAQESSSISAPETTSESVTSPADAVLKAILIISQVALLGITFNQIIFQRLPYFKRDTQLNIIRKEENKLIHLSPKRFATLLIISCISIIIFSTGIILLQSYELGQNLELDITSAFSIIYSTSVGQVWMWRLISSLIIISIIITYQIKKRKKVNKNKLYQGHGDIYFGHFRRDKLFLIAILVVSSISLYSNSMISHSNSLSTFSFLAVSMDWVHFMAVSVWIGGLFYLLMIPIRHSLIIIKNDNASDNYIENDISMINLQLNQIAKSLMYFSYIAICSISIIGITGLYLAFIHLQNLAAITTTSYGQILIIKLSMAISMVFIGRYNQNKIHRHIRQILSKSKDIKKDESNGPSSNGKLDKAFFRAINKSLTLESIIGILVLITASFLSVTSPPSLEATNQGLNLGEINSSNSNSILLSSLVFLYIIIILSIAILIIGIVNVMKNKRQIIELNTPSNTSKKGKR